MTLNTVIAIIAIVLLAPGLLMVTAIVVRVLLRGFKDGRNAAVVPAPGGREGADGGPAQPPSNSSD